MTVKPGSRSLAGRPGKKFRYEVEQKWESGERRLAMEIQPLTPIADKKNLLDLRLIACAYRDRSKKNTGAGRRTSSCFSARTFPKAQRSGVITRERF